MLAICDELNQQKFILDITDDKKNDENGKNNIASGGKMKRIKQANEIFTIITIKMKNTFEPSKNN
ncbi:3505_t:CDS:2 [Entrophospora sp. SA101]|nr:11136_t:CDS:2 [Entrophospora sp. SA101]CAJ0874759.1 3505_t:CDS:2 [Entrophospora sp. SA101]